MKTWPKPFNWSGEKFAARYGLNPNGDFGVTFVDGVEMIYVKDHAARRVTDEPPIFEAPGTPKPPVSERIKALVNVTPEVKEILTELARGR